MEDFDSRSIFDDAVKDMRDKQVREIDRLIKEMPVGYILCVHDAVFKYWDEHEIWSATMTAHFIRVPQDCQAQVRRTQYGPKTEDNVDGDQRTTSTPD